MPRDIMSSEPAAAVPHAQHCTGMANWPNTIQCLGSDDIISLGIKFSAFLRVLVLKNVQEFGPSFLDMFWTRMYVKNMFFFSGNRSHIRCHVMNNNCTFFIHMFFKIWVPFQVNFVAGCRRRYWCYYPLQIYQKYFSVNNMTNVRSPLQCFQNCGTTFGEQHLVNASDTC